MIDPQNAAILAEMRALGIRRRPVLGFLRRGHLINRWFGRLRSRASVPDALEAQGA
jgi:hypothetical protein